MDWNHDTRFDQYNLTVGAWHAAISPVSSGQWLAIITHGLRVTAYQHFAVLLPAQTWCEHMVSESGPTAS